VHGITLGTGFAAFPSLDKSCTSIVRFHPMPDKNLVVLDSFSLARMEKSTSAPKIFFIGFLVRKDLWVVGKLWNLMVAETMAG
jgi:hypothetical protein